MAAAGEHDTADGHLLRETAETFVQMAYTARKASSRVEYRVFFSHLAAWCLRLGDFRATSSHSHPEVVHQILLHLDSLIPRASLRELESDYSTTSDHLQLLNRLWKDLSADAELDFVSQWLRPSESEDEREIFERSFGSCTDELCRQYPAELLEDSEVNTQLHPIGEPSMTIWKPAQSVYNALLSCSLPHQFEAKFQLSTYRQSSITSSHQTPKRSVDAKSHGSLEFDMFLSREKVWHEVRVHADHYVKRSRVGFDIPADMASSPQKNLLRVRGKVEKLCAKLEVKSQQSRHLRRLKLKLTGDELFDMGFEKTNFPISWTTEAISLANFIEERPECFTEKTKRVLSLIIGCTVLHLHETSWLQPGWGSLNIAFFQTTSDEVPLRPFIQTELHDDTIETHDNDVFDDDEMFLSHLCPCLIDLAVVLMEIHFVKSFKRLADMRQIELLETRNGRVAFVDADQVFNGSREEDDDSDCEQNGLKSEIAGDFQNLILAIENCLDAELWEDEHQNPLGPETLRSRIYKKVIRPLELHLAYGFSEIPLDGVDKFARNIDFSQWGKTISSGKQTHSQYRGAETCPKAASPSTAPSVQSFANHVVRTETQSRMISSTLSYRPGRLVTADSDPSVGNAQGHFFDDETGPIFNHYDDWKRRYLSVYEKFIPKHFQSYLDTRVKIAILDTGIDEEHVLLEAHRDIKGKHNFYDTSRRRKVTDRSGHGTFAANLILDYAPDADLYVIKVADDNTLPDAEVVQNAIDHAVEVWRVGIISMSFGWPTANFAGHEGLRRSIDRAYSKQVLMFAAASNNGGNSGRAYPASSPHVICVHSTNTKGKISDFSPPAEEGTMNFSTVGESVLSAWLDTEEYVSRSGTSYATPILAGISAFLLQYARIHLSPEKSSEFSRKENMEALLRRCAERGPRYRSADGYSYIELSLHEHNLFGRELKDVNYEFLETLKR